MENMKEPIVKRFLVNGETVEKRVALRSIEQYDANGHKVSTIDSDCNKHQWEYDENGNETCHKDFSRGKMRTWFNEYDKDGNLVHITSRDHKDAGKTWETWYEYDKEGNLVYEKDSEGHQKRYEYNTDGRPIHVKNSRDENIKTKDIDFSPNLEEWYEYDEKGRLIYFKNNYGEETRTSYNENGVEICKKYLRLGEHEIVDIYESWKYDANGHEIYYSKDFYCGDEEWNEYDSHDNLIYEKTCRCSMVTRFDYDEKGNNVHSESDSGTEKWRDYNADGKCIHEKTNDGYETWYEYDSHGNIIYFKYSGGPEQWFEYEYDANGNKTYCARYDDHYDNMYLTYEVWFYYDEQGRETHWKNSHGVESWCKYDERGNKIYWMDYDCGIEYKYGYDESGKLIYEEPVDCGWKNVYEYDADGKKILDKCFEVRTEERWHDYDESGNILHSKSSLGLELWYEYEFWENGNIKQRVEYNTVDERD